MAQDTAGDRRADRIEETSTCNKQCSIMIQDATNNDTSGITPQHNNDIIYCIVLALVSLQI